MKQNQFAIIIEVRTSSKRLKNKCLKKINKKTILELLILRLSKIKNIKKIVATTSLKSDDRIEEICKKQNIDIFRGHPNDLVTRVISASEYFKIKNIIQLTGDNPFIDYRIILKLLKIFKTKKYNFVSNSINRTFPIGSDIRIFSLNDLKKISKIQKNFREHTCWYFLKNYKKFKTYNLKASKKLNRPDIRLTIDYSEDFKFAKKIFEHFKKNISSFSLEDVIKLINKQPKLLKINAKYPRQIKL